MKDIRFMKWDKKRRVLGDVYIMFCGKFYVREDVYLVVGI